MNLKLGDAVVFVDPMSHRRDAIVTALWGTPATPDDRDVTGTVTAIAHPCAINLVIVSDDPARHDTYGRQIERVTSVVHMSQMSAHGNYWRLASEEGKPTER